MTFIRFCRSARTKRITSGDPFDREKARGPARHNVSLVPRPDQIGETGLRQVGYSFSLSVAGEPTRRDPASRVALSETPERMVGSDSFPRPEHLRGPQECWCTRRTPATGTNWLQFTTIIDKQTRVAGRLWGSFRRALPSSKVPTPAIPIMTDSKTDPPYNAPYHQQTAGFWAVTVLTSRTSCGRYVVRAGQRNRFWRNHEVHTGAIQD